ncbi:hypothetical protein GCM10010324_04150 [Streptomyces hiroshimensis]|uniref:Uncharacterized protein n=1 Tax=Streptomyces hiroshimensis TaxID=66424 RepID=A0ABQ2Y4I5_9ACTN|nr:hypothetical protein GCM10010324_04150 [Streptomyces hiroshimensis]
MAIFGSSNGSVRYAYGPIVHDEGAPGERMRKRAAAPSVRRAAPRGARAHAPVVR